MTDQGSYPSDRSRIARVRLDCVAQLSTKPVELLLIAAQLNVEILAGATLFGGTESNHAASHIGAH